MEKPTIVTIGTIKKDNMSTTFCNWCFDSSELQNPPPMFHFKEEGEILVCGYTVDELEIIAGELK